MPDIDADAYELSSKELVYRRMELHHACIQIIVEQLQYLSEGNIMHTYADATSCNDR